VAVATTDSVPRADGDDGGAGVGTLRTTVGVAELPCPAEGWTGAEPGVIDGGTLGGAAGTVAAEAAGRMSEAYAGNAPDGADAVAAGPDVVAGPDIICGAGADSEAETCETGAGASYPWATAGTPAPAIGVVAGDGGPCGSVGAIWAGGSPPVPADPACRPLSKLCSRSPGVVGWGPPVGGTGEAVIPAGEVLGKPELTPLIGDPGIEPPPCGIEGAEVVGSCAAVGAGAGACGAGPGPPEPTPGGTPPPLVKLIGEFFGDIGAWGPDCGGAVVPVLLNASGPVGAGV
jgi:hypothetical protein